MDVRVRDAAPPTPFLSARDLFVTEFDLDRPVEVRVTDDPDERTRTGHTDDHHVLITSRRAATGAMARELALHEYAHMWHHETAHPSHTQPIDEALFLALAGTSVERRVISHCHQIANHMKDIYADDVTLAVDAGDKLVPFLEARLAAAVADRPAAGPHRPGWRFSSESDPAITAVNAAFALALGERHGLLDDDHRLYDLAHAAADDAPAIALDWYRDRFRSLDPHTDERTYREVLVGVTRRYASDVRDGGEADVACPDT